MAKKIIQAQMQQRRDTKANWATKNPVLLAGELGIVSDDPNLYKVGDGTTAWNALPFRGFDGTLVHTTGDSETAVMSQKAVTKGLTELSQEMTEKVNKSEVATINGQSLVKGGNIKIELNKPKYPQNVFDAENIKNFTLTGNSATNFKFIPSDTDKAYICEIPQGTRTIAIKEVGVGTGYVYGGMYFFNRDMEAIQYAPEFGNGSVNLFKVYAVPENAAFYGLTWKTPYHEVSELAVMYDIPVGEFYALTIQAQIVKSFKNGFNYYLAHQDEKVIPSYNLLDLKNAIELDEYHIKLQIPIVGAHVLFVDGIKSYKTDEMLAAYDSEGNKIYSRNFYGENSTNDISCGAGGFLGGHDISRSFILPNETAWVTLNLPYDAVHENTFSYVELVANSTMNVDYHYKNLPIGEKTALFEKKIACFGDSITSFGSSASDSYAWKMMDRYACQVRNYGRGNARFIDKEDTDITSNTNPEEGKTPNNVVSTQLRWMKRENFIPDIAIVSGCTNDAFSEVNLGNLEEEFDLYPNTTGLKNDFFKMCVYAVSMLREINPKMQIFFATPIRSLNTSQMVRLTTYVENFRLAANKLGCGLVDWYKESGIIEKPSDSANNPFFTDDLHPSDAGTDLMLSLALRVIE